MKLYKSYAFRTKDPVIDELRTIAEGEFGERIRHRHLKRIEDEGGPSASAMRNWFFGKTMRPSSSSTEAAGRAMGYKRTWTRFKKVKLDGGG